MKEQVIKLAEASNFVAIRNLAAEAGMKHSKKEKTKDKIGNEYTVSCDGKDCVFRLTVLYRSFCDAKYQLEMGRPGKKQFTIEFLDPFMGEDLRGAAAAMYAVGLSPRQVKMYCQQYILKRDMP